MGKVIALISEGIDSPVAAALALSQKHELIALHMDCYPSGSDENVKKTRRLVQHLSNHFQKQIKFFSAPYREFQQTIAKNAKRKYICVLCKRSMLKIAERIALREGADAIVTGESLGQVASQTLPNLIILKQAVGITVAQPLIGMDKMEIEMLARKFGTREISIEKGLACEVVPDKPSTKAMLEDVYKEEKKAGFEEIIEDSLNNCKSEAIKPKKR